jgi:hypothetical protein
LALFVISLPAILLARTGSAGANSDVNGGMKLRRRRSRSRSRLWLASRDSDKRCELSWIWRGSLSLFQCRKQWKEGPGIPKWRKSRKA